MELQNAIKEFYGEDLFHNEEYGRIVSAEHTRRLLEILRRDREYIVTGGGGDQNARYIEPAVLCPPIEAACMQEELFGPLLPVLSDHAIYRQYQKKPVDVALALIAGLRDGKVELAASQEGQSWKVQEAVTRNQEAIDPAELQAVFRMSKPQAKDKPTFGSVTLNDGSFVVLRLNGVNEGAAASDEEKAAIRYLSFLTLKPTMYIANVNEDGFENNPYLDQVRAIAAKEGSVVVPVCAAIEADLAEMEEEDRAEFMAELGLEEPGLNRVIRAGYELLNLQTYFTAGVKEVRAWTIPVGATAPQAAGKIHTDFEKGFIRAQTIAFDDFITYKGEQGAKEAGKMRAEGKDYIVKDGDVLNFLFNV